MTACTAAHARPVYWDSLLVGGFLLWLSATPYMGIDHDARLYVLMALRHLTPDAYVQDPWFAWGSQDDWSVYSPLLAKVLTIFGVQHGALLMTLLQGALFVVASAVFCRAWLRGPAAMLAFLFIVSIPIFYSPAGMLSVSEGFVTARGMAVPLSLLALGVVRYQRGGAFLLHLLALSMHPIMGLGPLLVSCLLCVPRRFVAASIAITVALAAAGFAAGGAGGLPLLDAEWLYFVEPAVLVFIGPWVQKDGASLMLVFLVLLLGSLFGARRLRALYMAAGVIGGGGLVISLVATAIPVAIVLQAQLWRTFWLCVVLGLIASADLLCRYVIRRRAAWRWFWLCALITLIMVRYFVGDVIAAGCVAIGGALGMLPSCRSTAKQVALVLSARHKWVLVFLSAFSLLMLPSFLLSLELSATSVRGVQGLMLPVEGFFRSGGFGALALIFFLLARWAQKVLLPLLLLPAIFLSMGYWDVRAAVLRDQEARYSVDGRNNPFPGWIRRGDVVYWHQQPERVWLELGTAGYASTTHCTGLVFSRERTMLLSDRMIKVAALGMGRDDFETAAASGQLRDQALRSARPLGVRNEAVLASYEARVAASAFGVENMCKDFSLQWVVDPFRIDGLFVDSVQEFLGGVRGHLYLYDCARFR